MLHVVILSVVAPNNNGTMYHKNKLIGGSTTKVNQTIRLLIVLL
jgi:hypothetical protein